MNSIVQVERSDRELYKFILDAPYATGSRIDNMPDDAPELQAIAKHRQSADAAYWRGRYTGMIEALRRTYTPEQLAEMGFA